MSENISEPVHCTKRYSLVPYEQTQYLWKCQMNSNNRIDLEWLKLVDLRISGKSYFDPHLSCSDLSWATEFTSNYWNLTNKKIDPVRLMEANLERTFEVDDVMEIEAKLKNEYKFPLECVALDFLDSNDSVMCSARDISIKPNETISIKFKASLAEIGSFRLSKFRAYIGDFYVGFVPINQKWFRLNTKKADFITPAYADNKANVLRVVPRGEILHTDLDVSKCIGYSWENASITLNVDYRSADSKIIVAILSENVTPVDCKVKNVKGLRLVECPEKSFSIKFKLLIPDEPITDVRFAVYEEGSLGSYPKLVKHRIRNRKAVQILSQAVHGVELPYPLVVSLVLSSNISGLRVKKAELVIDGSHFDSLGVTSFTLNQQEPYSLSFTVPRKSFDKARLKLRLDDETVLSIPLEFEFTVQSNISYQLIKSENTEKCVNEYQIEISGETLFVHRDHPESQTFILGEIRRQLDPSQTSTLQVASFSTQPDYHCIHSPIDEDSLMISTFEK